MWVEDTQKNTLYTLLYTHMSIYIYSIHTFTQGDLETMASPKLNVKQAAQELFTSSIRSVWTNQTNSENVLMFRSQIPPISDQFQFVCHLTIWILF